MQILAIAQVEDKSFISKEIEKQTIKPDHVFFHIDDNPASGLIERRKRIAYNHQFLVEAVNELNPVYIWQIEQDSELPVDCLERLLEDHKKLDNGKDKIGYISGVEVGRHGLYCLGAWKNIKEDSFESLDYRSKGLQEVDGTGFYCLLAKKNVWLSGHTSWDGEPYGPDVVYSLSLKKQGYKIYCDMDIQIGHKTKRGTIKVTDMSTCNAQFFIKDGEWKYKQL